MAVRVYAMQLHLQQKQPNLKLKTWPKQLLGYLPLAFALPIIMKKQIFEAWAVMRDHRHLSNIDSV